jgi:hypothetical protein
MDGTLSIILGGGINIDGAVAVTAARAPAAKNTNVGIDTCTICLSERRATLQRGTAELTTFRISTKN